jgi:nitrogen regulatory protein PII
VAVVGLTYDRNKKEDTMKKKEMKEYTAECTITIVVEADSVDEATELIQDKLDNVGLDGNIDSIDPDTDEEEEEEEEEDSE